MKILNKSDNIIIEVENEERIKKLLGYPDKFEVVDEPQPSYFQNDKKGKKGGKKDKEVVEDTTEESAEIQEETEENFSDEGIEESAEIQEEI